MNIIGHQKILDYFTKAMENRYLAHAYLFIGPEHVGKTTAVKWVIDKVLSKKGPPLNPPLSKRGINRPNPDLIWLKREEGKKEIPIEAIRNLRMRLSQKPLVYSHKVIVIENAENLSLPAVNALLKTLEEPQGRSLIILTANNLQRVPETIISRCQVIKFNKVSTKVIAKSLQNDEAIPEIATLPPPFTKGGVARNDQEEWLRNLVKLSSGRPGLVLKWLEDQDSYQEKIKIANEFVDLMSYDLNGKFAYVEDILPKSRTLIIQINKALDYISEWQAVLRDLMLLKMDLSDKITYDQLNKELANLSENVSLSRISQLQKQIEQTKNLLKQNVNPRLAMENLVLNF